jgi:hypothetical protein
MDGDSGMFSKSCHVFFFWWEIFESLSGWSENACKMTGNWGVETEASFTAQPVASVVQCHWYDNWMNWGISMDWKPPCDSMCPSLLKHLLRYPFVRLMLMACCGTPKECSGFHSQLGGTDGCSRPQVS